MAATRTRGPFTSDQENGDRPVESLAPVEHAGLPEPTFNEKAVAEILQRAAALERSERSAGSALTQSEIETIARDAGIDPRLVRQAIAERQGQAPATLGTGLAGAPLRRTVERVVDVELTQAHHELLGEEIRRALSHHATLPVTAASLGRSLTVNAVSRRSMVEVAITPEGKRTRIRVSINASPLAGGLYGGIIGGVGGGFGVNAALLTGTALANLQGAPVPLAIAGGVAALAGVVGGAYALARTIFVNTVRPLHRQADDLVERVARRLQYGG